MRTHAGFPSARSAAQAMGVREATYRQHENGTRAMPARTFEDYTIFLRAKILMDGATPAESCVAGPLHEWLAKKVWTEIQETLPGSGDWDSLSRRDPDVAEQYRSQVDRLFRHLDLPLPPSRRHASAR